MNDQNEKQAVTIEAIKADKELTESAICRIISEFAERNSVNVDDVILYTQANLSGQTETVGYAVELEVKI